MSGDSSSSEDENKKIKEAVDGTFLTEDLYAIDKLETKIITPQKKAPSLRNRDHQEVSLNPFTIKVTSEFQKHVSKHLSKLLDDLIDDSKILKKYKKLRVKKNVNSGVKLLSSSKDYLMSTGPHNMNGTPRKLLIKADLNEINYEERAREVAVSPEWILSKEETKSWMPDTKGIIEVVKLDEKFNRKINKKIIYE